VLVDLSIKMKCFFAVEKYLDKDTLSSTVWFNIKVWVEFTPEESMKDQKGGRSMVLLFRCPRH